MSYRGRGRGRGGYYRPSAKEEKYEIFPEIKEYPDVNLKRKKEFERLISLGNKLQVFWKSSPYHLEALGQDSERNGGIRKIPLSEYIKMTSDYVPAELDLQRLDLFEKLDRGTQGQDDDDEKEKKEDEEDDENDENIEGDEDESGDDYNQTFGYDDDEDDFNLSDPGEDEGFYE
ncbi:hypothetical protein M8C21_030855 [Ambrosia artemisiifolia]|uniref:DNA-directed RNA polymerase III subunit n=1 Tax=Ambrosia artemisiifolia TaxID=4212 RepID=A0AAD5C4Q0_AMBAR|nr:hypothetical protein M8C21_030855 [Ambrosia artemisiifolia]